MFEEVAFTAYLRRDTIAILVCLSENAMMSLSLFEIGARNDVPLFWLL